MCVCVCGWVGGWVGVGVWSLCVYVYVWCVCGVCGFSVYVYLVWLVWPLTVTIYSWSLQLFQWDKDNVIITGSSDGIVRVCADAWWCHDDVMVITWWYAMISWRCQTFRVKAFSKSTLFDQFYNPATNYFITWFVWLDSIQENSIRIIFGVTSTVWVVKRTQGLSSSTLS